MWYSNNFKQKIGESVSGGKVLSGTLNKLGELMTDSQITNKWNITPLSIPDFFATVHNLIDTGEMNKEVYGYIFYVKATDGRTLAVGARWSDEQWKFGCSEFDGHGGWDAGQCVFSPAIPENPSPTLSPSTSDTYCNCKRCEHCGKIIK